MEDNINNEQPKPVKPLIHRIHELEKHIESLNTKMSSQETPEFEQNVSTLANDLNELAQKVTMIVSDIEDLKKAVSANALQQSDLRGMRSLQDDVVSLSKKVGDMEVLGKKLNEDVYSQLGEIIELIMVWEKRMAAVEEELKSIEVIDKEKIQEITRAIRNQTAEVKIMKAKQDILNQLAKGHMQ